MTGDNSPMPRAHVISINAETTPGPWRFIQVGGGCYRLMAIGRHQQRVRFAVE